MRASFYKQQVEQVLQLVAQDQDAEIERDEVDRIEADRIEADRIEADRIEADRIEADRIEGLPVSDYTDPQRLLQEQAMFRRLPILIAHSSALAEAGDYLVTELDGRSWLLVRGKDGVARAFYNYCQHRGTKLVHDEAGCKQRFSCPYHSWTYNTQGDLIGVPRVDLFPGLDKSAKGLKQADLQEAYGFLWLTQDLSQAQPVADYFGELSEELEALDLGSYHVYFDKTRELSASWKLPLFAFLESYHIGTLHRESIAEFFFENVAFSEQFGPHIRSFVPRKTVVELDGVDLDQYNISEYITPTNILFPNVCMIAHPTSYSVIMVFPGETPGSSSWRHILLVPDQPRTDAERAHFDKTIAVLDGMTYEGEDFWVSEQIQAGINAGAISELTLGTSEVLLKVFNDSVNRYLPSNT